MDRAQITMGSGSIPCMQLVFHAFDGSQYTLASPFFLAAGTLGKRRRSSTPGRALAWPPTSKTSAFFLSAIPFRFASTSELASPPRKWPDAIPSLSRPHRFLTLFRASGHSLNPQVHEEGDGHLHVLQARRRNLRRKAPCTRNEFQTWRKTMRPYSPGLT